MLNYPKCKDCYKVLSDYRAKYCKKCFGKYNYHYRQGISMRPHFCVDCGTQVAHYLSKRCRQCADKSHALKMRGKNNPMYGRSRTGKQNPFYGKNHSLISKKKISLTKIGKKLSRNTIRKIIKNSAKYWLNKQLPLRICKKISLTRIKRQVAKGKNNPMYGKKAKHGKRYMYKGIFMRSSWETLFAQFLDLNGLKWQYEPQIFYLKNATYRPDFYIKDFDLFIEIKGWWRDNAKKKYLQFKNRYKDINIKILKRRQLNELGILN
jgi:hypothetical protein